MVAVTCQENLVSCHRVKCEGLISFPGEGEGNNAPRHLMVTKTMTSSRTGGLLSVCKPLTITNNEYPVDI